MFRPNLEPFVGIWGIPDQYKSESLHKTDYCNVPSDFFIKGTQRHLAAFSGCSRRHRSLLDWASDSWRNSLLFYHSDLLM